jgi:hypothetical protein
VRTGFVLLRVTVLLRLFPAISRHNQPQQKQTNHAGSPISPSLWKVSSICGYGESDPADAVRAPFGLDSYVGGVKVDVGGGGGEIALECSSLVSRASSNTTAHAASPLQFIKTKLIQ